MNMPVQAAREQDGREDAEYAGVLEHAVQSILAAQVFSRPYPHLHFESFFSSEFYRRLLDNFPANDRFFPLNAQGTRRQFNLFDEASDPGTQAGRALWSIVSRMLNSQEMAEALRARLEEGFRIRAKGSKEAWPIPMHPRPVLYTDLDGYAIKPHPDTRKKVLTMQIYMPSDDSQRELGTTVYKVSPMGVFHWKTYGLVKAKTFPFLPNTGYAFVVIHPAYSLLKTSWHGRETISTPVDKPRLTILNTYYREPAKGASAGM
jgi:hypothetical protein